MCMAVGKVSLDDCEALTSSLGCNTFFASVSFPPWSTWARLAITSLTFMLLCVPEPVCQTTNGNWSSSLPARISSHTRPMSSAFSADRAPRSTLVRAAAFLRMAKARITSIGICWPPILKFSEERCVCAAQYLSAGTSTKPRLSFSLRYSIEKYYLNEANRSLSVFAAKVSPAAVNSAPPTS